MNKESSLILWTFWFFGWSGFFASLLLSGLGNSYIQLEYQIMQGVGSMVFLGFGVIMLVEYSALRISTLQKLREVAEN